MGYTSTPSVVTWHYPRALFLSLAANGSAVCLFDRLSEVSAQYWDISISCPPFSLTTLSTEFSSAPLGWMWDGDTGCWIVRNLCSPFLRVATVLSLKRYGQPSLGQICPSALQGLVPGSSCCCPPASACGWGCRGAEGSGMALGHREVNVWGKDTCQGRHPSEPSCTNPAGRFGWEGCVARGHPAGLGKAWRKW